MNYDFYVFLDTVNAVSTVYINNIPQFISACTLCAD